jgi:tungstate transport system ATP-binding protein
MKEPALSQTPPNGRPGARSPLLPLVLEEVGFAVGKQVLLRNVNLEFGNRTTTVVLGPNGAGKTLLIKLCHGLLRPTSGSLRWSNPAAARRRDAQAMVFQRPVLLRRSVAANIHYALRVARVARGKRADRLQEALALAGLSAMAARPARVLSGGEQQRLALARAWALHPQVLFLDEPTANLDPAATRRVEEMVASIREAGTKIIMTTHDMGQAHRLADEIVFLHQGSVVESGDAESFFERPLTQTAAAFLQGRLLW